MFNSVTMDFEYICMYVCVFILHLGLSSIPIHFFLSIRAFRRGHSSQEVLNLPNTIKNWESAELLLNYRFNTLSYFQYHTNTYRRVVHLLIFVLASNPNILTTGTQDLNWVKQFFPQPLTILNHGPRKRLCFCSSIIRALNVFKTSLISNGPSTTHTHIQKQWVPGSHFMVGKNLQQRRCIKKRPRADS